jgi:hypothetical protein
MWASLNSNALSEKDPSAAAARACAKLEPQGDGNG